MPTPMERLEARKEQRYGCKLCAVLDQMTDQDLAAGWREAINDSRFGDRMISTELEKDGINVSDGSVRKHRQKGH